MLALVTYSERVLILEVYNSVSIYGLCFTSVLSVLPTSQVGYYPYKRIESVVCCLIIYIDTVFEIIVMFCCFWIPYKQSLLVGAYILGERSTTEARVSETNIKHRNFRVDQTDGLGTSHPSK